MNIAIRYQSLGGNTKAVAEVIAETTRVAAEDICIPVFDADVLFLGGGVYAFSLNKKLKEFIDGLNPDHIKKIAAFSTAAMASGAKKIIKYAKKKGFAVYKKILPLRVGIKNYGGKGHPELSEKQIKKIKNFARQAIQN